MSYYSVLGVEPTASLADIKSAFKTKAKQSHPDTGGDTEAFKQLNEAYDTLKDPAKRKAYDRMQSMPGGIHVRSNNVNEGFSDIFDSVFRDLNGFGFDVRAQRQRQQRNRDLGITVTLTLRESLQQTNKTVSVRKVSGERDLVNITIPAGIRTGTTMKYSKMGDDTLKGIVRGDLYVTVTVMPDPHYKIEDGRLTTDITIDAFQAMVGCAVELTTLEEKTIKINIHPGIQFGTVLAVNGHGLYNKSGGRDKLHVKVLVKIPENLTQERLNTIRRFMES